MKEFYCPKCLNDKIEIRYFRFKGSDEEQLSCCCSRCRYRWNQPIAEKEGGDKYDCRTDVRRTR